MPLNSIHRPVSGLQTAQRNLAVTGHNMANVSTQGFSRQRVNQASFAYNTIGRTASSTNQVGLGTSIVGIQQLRHQFLDIQYRMEIGRANFYDRMHGVSRDIELTMAELTRVNEGTSGILATNRLWSSLQELSMNPSGMDTRSNFISAAGSYITQMSDTHRRLMEQKNVLNGEVKDKVNEVNRLVQTIHDMNTAIAREEATGQAANDFRDTRNLAMDRLASILDVDFRTDPRNGHVNVLSNGHPLLSNGQIQHVGLRYTEPGSSFVEPVVGPNVRPGDMPLLFDATFRNAHSLLRLDRPPVDIDRPGSLMGVVMARGLFSTNHSSQFQRIGFTYTGVTPTNPSGFTATPPGTPPTHIADGRGGFLEIGPDITPQEAQRAIQQQEARMAFNADHTIIPRTIRHLDTAFNHIVSLINEMFTNQNTDITDRSTWGGPTGPGDHTVNLNSYEDVPGPPPTNRQHGIPIFTVINENLMNPYHIYQGYFNDIHPNNLNLTLGNVQLNAIFDTPVGYNYLGTARNELDRDDTYIIINHLLEAWQKDLVSVDGSTPMSVDDFYRHIVTEAAVRTQELENAASTQNFIVGQADGERNRAFGVSLDEEMTNMIQFQHSFNAASRVVNIINEMIGTIINM